MFSQRGSSQKNGYIRDSQQTTRCFRTPKRCRYRTGTAERKYGEFGRFLHKRIDGIESVAGQGWDCAWTVRGLRRKRRPCAQSKDSRNELETPCRVEERLSILCTH